MSDDYNRMFNLVGLLLSLAGVLILFRWGMPFRVPTQGEIGIIAQQVDTQAIAIERVYKRIGYGGLALMILGTVLQMVAVLMAR